MKKMQISQMGSLQGGMTPSKTQVACYVASVVYGFVNPILGIIAGGVCLFAD